MIILAKVFGALSLYQTLPSALHTLTPLARWVRQSLSLSSFSGGKGDELICIGIGLAMHHLLLVFTFSEMSYRYRCEFRRRFGGVGGVSKCFYLFSYYYCFSVCWC